MYDIILLEVACDLEQMPCNHSNILSSKIMQVNIAKLLSVEILHNEYHLRLLFIDFMQPRNARMSQQPHDLYLLPHQSIQHVFIEYYSVVYRLRSEHTLAFQIAALYAFEKAP